MAIMGADLNRTAMVYESGAYGAVTGTGFWPGRVQNFTPSDDSQGIQRIRYHNGTTRNRDASIVGDQNYGGVLDLFPDDWKLLMYTLGNGSDTTTGSPAYYSHVLSELNSDDSNPFTSGTRKPFSSFTLESAQMYATDSNLVRLYNGCVVDSLKITADQNTPIVFSANIMAQNMTYDSGAPTYTVSEPTGRPQITSDTEVHLPSGTAMPFKSWDLTINNNFARDKAHICNGSRVMAAPIPENREYVFNATMDAESTEAKRLYGIWKSGGDVQINGGIWVKSRYGNTASGTHWISMSGCDIDAFNAPNPMEGINEWSLTLIPTAVDALIQDQTEKYLSW